MNIPFLPDEYTMRARVAPALLVVLPIALLTLVWTSGAPGRSEIVWAVFVSAGGVVLLDQLGRDRGKTKQRELFNDDGGLPTARVLTHKDCVNPFVLRHRHATLRRLFPELPIPETQEAESKDETAAALVYDAAVVLMRAKTRDAKRFPLVFAENCNFGFRRNLWAWKDLGITISVGATLILGARLFGQFSQHEHVEPMDIAIEIANAVATWLWLSVVTAKWAKVPAREYANRLAEALDDM